MSTKTQKYNLKVTLFGSLEKGGSMQVREFVDYPGINMVSIKETRNSNWTQTITYGEKEYKTAFEAVTAWQADQVEK